MGSLFGSLLDASKALSVYSQALNVVSENVTNANTPGYARQEAAFSALPFDVSVGMPGGITYGGTESTRNAYAEQNVRNQQSLNNAYQQQVSDLGQVSTLFDVSDQSGVSYATDQLFSSFSSLSVSPNDPTARQGVLTAATNLAEAFQNTANGLLNAGSQEQQEAQSTVSQINSLAGTIAQINGEHSPDAHGSVDAGVDAQLNSALEQLSQYVNFSPIQQPNGTVTIYVGTTPLVADTTVNPIGANYSSSSIQITSVDGQDLTSQITQGQLGGILNVENNKIPAYVSSLNTLARGLADQVNSALSTGIDVNGNTPTNNLFTYDPANAAQTFAVNPQITPDQLAAASAGAPGGNGNALAISTMGAAKNLDGYSFDGYFGQIGANVGTDLNYAQSGATSSASLLNQAQTLRSQQSGVDLNVEAQKLLEYQSSYQANAKLFQTLDQLTQTTLNLIPNG